MKVIDDGHVEIAADFARLPEAGKVYSLNADGGMWVEQMVPLLGAGYTSYQFGIQIDLFQFIQTY